jgi:TolB protein
MNIRRFTHFLYSVLFLCSANIAAAVEFEIYQGDFKPLHVAVVIDAPAQWQQEAKLVQSVISHDLVSSQSFKSLNALAFLASANDVFQHIDYSDWSTIGSDILVAGKLNHSASGWRIDIRVYQVLQRKILAVKTLSTNAHGLRRLGHQSANVAYQAALDIPGHFDTHVVFVRKSGQYSDLMYMDQDGYNLQTVGHNFTLLLSPDWSPDGHTVALNTYVGNRPQLETFDLRTGKREPFGTFKGLNSTPEYSPDGRYIAASLSYTGNPEIFIYDTHTKKWRQFTHDRGIDTTPTWSPDGQWIAFASSRSGSPQVYKKAFTGGSAIRVSTQGYYNTSPVWSPKGDRIAIISQKNWQYAVATIDVDGSDVRYLATGSRIESPTWSPNGQMILYSAEDHHRRRVYMVPTWGGSPRAITSSEMDASDPAWSK